MPFFTFGHPDQLDPPVSSRVSPDDVVGPVRRAVADDDPFGRSDRLPHHGLDRPFDELCFVPRRGDEHVGREAASFRRRSRGLNRLRRGVHVRPRSSPYAAPLAASRRLPPPPPNCRTPPPSPPPTPPYT